MNKTCIRGRGAIHRENGGATAFDPIRWLSLAATPTFAIMALLTGIFTDGTPDLLCPASHGGSLLSGMTLMYLLMGAFHSPPWLKLFLTKQRTNPS